MRPTQHKHEVFAIGFQAVSLLRDRKASYIYVLGATIFMKHFPFAFLIFPSFIFALMKEHPHNVDFWQFRLNDKVLVKGNIPMSDTTILIDTASLGKRDIFHFIYFPDSQQIGSEKESWLYFSYPNGSRRLVSYEKTTQGALYCYFLAEMFKQIADSTKFYSFELQFTSTYLNHIDVSKPTTFCKIKVK